LNFIRLPYAKDDGAVTGLDSLRVIVRVRGSSDVAELRAYGDAPAPGVPL
jgi:hypothetical protein